MGEVFALGQALARAKMTQRQLAAMIGVSPATVCFWVAGRRQPGAARLPLIAAALDCSIDDLFARRSA